MNETDIFQIKTESFVGPLDLLLSLIEKRKLFISDISLAEVADDFITHINSFDEFPVDMTAHFILVASTLLLIKSKSLLPSIPLTTEEQGSIEDLELRLKMYQRVKDVSQHIANKFGKEIIFTKTQSKIINPIFSPNEDMTALNMLQSIKRVIESIPKKELLPKTVVRKIISLEEMISRLTERVQGSLKMNFSDFASTQGETSSSGSRHKTNKEDKVKIIVSFLAMLELVKQGLIQVTQNDFSEDIYMETKKLGVPQYE